MRWTFRWQRSRWICCSWSNAAMWDFKMEWPVSLGLGPRLLIWCEMNRLCYASILSIEMYWSWLQPLTPKSGSLHMYSITSCSELHRWLASFGFQLDGQWKKNVERFYFRVGGLLWELRQVLCESLRPGEVLQNIQILAGLSGMDGFELWIQ